MMLILAMVDVQARQWQKKQHFLFSTVQSSHLRKRQRRQLPNWGKCFCHVQDEPGTLTDFSIKKLAKISIMSQGTERCYVDRDEGFLEEGPKSKYHRRCYEVYNDRECLGAASKCFHRRPSRR